MREVHRSQLQIGQVPIEKIWINPKSRDDIPAVLKGLQHILCEEALRARLLALLDGRERSRSPKKCSRVSLKAQRTAEAALPTALRSCSTSRTLVNLQRVSIRGPVTKGCGPIPLPVVPLADAMT